MQSLSLEEFLALAKTAKRVAVFTEIPIGTFTPADIYFLINNEIRHGFIFEDLLTTNKNRYSFLGFDPIAKIEATHDLVKQTINNITTTQQINPFTALKNLLIELSYTSRADAADLLNAAFGFITYDAVRFSENIPDRHTNDTDIPDFFFTIYQTTLTFDHHRQMLLISSMVEVGDEPTQAYQHGQQQITNIIALLSQTHGENPFQQSMHIKEAMPAEVDIADSDFIQMVNTAKEYITHGDAFQIVLSRRFRQRYDTSPLHIYKTLRKQSPAPFMFYFPIDNSVIMGASPERFIQVQNGKITINPIAGTRKRTATTNDAEISADLLSDQKELAEHMMLVDLARNDLGAVSIPGSVQVAELLKVKHYSHVSHITSVVTGQLQDKFHAFDAFTAAFPAGTLSGAPKIRAMQIIDELETSRRGLYGGAICRLDYQGNLDSCIAIRMAVLKDGMATVRAGAGIVYDSNPAAEALETRQKAQAMLDAIAKPN